MEKPNFGRVLDRVVDGICAAVMLCMIALTVVDVVGRYVFRIPVPGSFEITELLVALVIFAGLPAVSKDETHITVDIVTSVLRGRARTVQLVLANAAAAIISAVVAGFMLLKAADVTAQREVTAYLQFPLGPAAYFMSFSCALTAAILVANVWRHAKGGKGDTSDRLQPGAQS